MSEKVSACSHNEGGLGLATATLRTFGSLGNRRFPLTLKNIVGGPDSCDAPSAKCNCLVTQGTQISSRYCSQR